MLHVFEYLNWQDLDRARLVCFTWKQLADELLQKSFWMSCCSTQKSFDEAMKEVMNRFEYPHSRPTLGFAFYSPKYKLSTNNFLTNYLFQYIPQKTQIIGAIVEAIIGTNPDGTIQEIEKGF